MAKTRTIVLNLVIIIIALVIIFIIVDMFTGVFGNSEELLAFFNSLLSGGIFSMIFMILALGHVPLSIIFGIVLIWRRYKIKVYPFVLIIWIYPLMSLLPLIIPIFSGPVDLYILFSSFSSAIITSFLAILLPSLFISILALLVKKPAKEKRVMGRVSDISIRTPTARRTFPLERELIFISYATIDSNFYQIPRLTRILTSYPEIDKILYWESDMHDDIYRYMDSNLKRSKIVLLFCSKNSLYSEAVNMEWSSALKLNKRIIPIFTDPEHIPALLTTKLGVQYSVNDSFSSIEDIYNMILKKLEIESVREFTRFIIPKWITAEDFNLQLPPEETVEETLRFESDITSRNLGIQIGSILEDNNFHVPGLKKALKDMRKKKKKKKDSSEITEEPDFTEFSSFAELRDDPETIAILVKIDKITDENSTVLLNLKGKREWVLKEILKDIDLKLIELKSKTELIRNYSDKVISLMENVIDIERFLRNNLGSSIKKVEELITQYKNKEFDEEQFIIKGTQSIGKDFIIVFLRNMSLILKENKEMIESKPPSQTQIAF